MSERRGSWLPKWSVIERWTDGDPEPCITTMERRKDDAQRSARLYAQTTGPDLAYDVMLTSDALGVVAASSQEQGS